MGIWMSIIINDIIFTGWIDPSRILYILHNRDLSTGQLFWGDLQRTDVSEQAGRSTVEQSQGKSGQSKRSGRKKREERALLTSVTEIIARDQRILRREKRKWEESKEIAERQMEKLDKVYEGTKRAIRFYEGCPPKIKESLRNPNNWNQYPELGYVNEIGDLY